MIEFMAKYPYGGLLIGALIQLAFGVLIYLEGK